MTYKGRIKFDNREWLLIDKLNYKGIDYYYIIEDVSEELNNLNSIEDYKGKICIEFIYKLDEKNYKNVTDQNLLDDLLALMGQKVIEENKK